MKTAEQLEALKEEAETRKENLAEVNKEELEQRAGGGEIPWGPFHDVVVSCPHCRRRQVVNSFPAKCLFCRSIIFEYNG